MCAHPAIELAHRTPLLLKTVLGLDAARIAPEFVVIPAAMSKRLTRAKTKLREARVPFEIPEPSELAERSMPSSRRSTRCTRWLGMTFRVPIPRSKDLTTEAVGLGRLVVQQLPLEPESKGLLALML